jgi:hypothetical protein
VYDILERLTWQMCGQYSGKVPGKFPICKPPA